MDVGARVAAKLEDADVTRQEDIVVLDVLVLHATILNIQVHSLHYAWQQPHTYIYLSLSDVNEEVTPDRDADSTEEDPNEELCEGMHS